MSYHRRTTCRICGSDRLELFLSLGPMPLANSFPRSAEEFAAEPSFPLDVCLCRDCSLVQTPDVIDPEVLFRHYIYVSRTSDTIAAHYVDYARFVVESLRLTAGDLVVEAASNDGSLLRCFQAHGVRTLGVEPAVNIAEQARAAGVETRTDFFNQSTAAALREELGPARAVIANNVLAHVDDTVDFLRGCRMLLADDGAVFVEVPYLGDLLDRLEYDTIYHEHLCYFSVTAMVRLCREAQLAVHGIDHVPIHGGSLRLRAGLPRTDMPEVDTATATWMDKERTFGFTEPQRYRRFAEDVAGSRTDLTKLLRALRASGKSVAAYGAPAKGNTLLNYCRIGTDLIAFTVDKNPMKVGLYTPGMHLPVLPPEALVERRPDYVVILAWNFAEEIMRQQRHYRDGGGRFIIPVPRPEIV